VRLPRPGNKIVTDFSFVKKYRAFKNSFHSTLVVRLGLTATIFSVLMGIGVYYYELQKIDRELVKLAIAESRIFSDKIISYLPAKTQDDRSAIDGELWAFVAQRSETDTGDGYFVFAEVYGPNHEKIAESAKPGREYVEKAIDNTVTRFPVGTGVWHRKFKIGNELFMQALTNLSAPGHVNVGTFEGVYQVSPVTLARITDAALGSVFLVVLVVLLTSAVLYPVIVSLNRGLLAQSRVLLRSNAEMLAATEEAERASKAKTEFLGRMSHELRTPLNAIIGFSEVLRSQFFGPLGSENYKDYANDIHDSGQRMLSLVNDILEMTAIESGTLTFSMENLQIGNLLQDAVTHFQAQADDAGITLSSDIPADLPPLWGDESALRQIVRHLVSNAVKFTEPGGAVTLRANSTGDGSMSIEVHDTGIGIPADKLSIVTDSFSQVDSNPHRAHAGAGLGLALVLSLVNAHNGELQIASEVGNGTRVTVTFPIHPDH